MNKNIFLCFFFIFIPFVIAQETESISQIVITQAVEKFKLFQKDSAYKKLAFTVLISPKLQKLYLLNGKDILKEYPISSAKNGIGCEENSLKTPYGMHKVSERFGDFGKVGAIFKERKYTGEFANIITSKVDVPTDYVISRILWLDGLEENNKNSKARFIYIHGTHEEGLIGMPASHGCIRMLNADVIELFDYMPINTLVEILQD